jgi:hypothetical protein
MKMQRERFMPSVSGLTDATSASSGSQELRAISGNWNNPEANQPQVVQIEAGVWRQMLSNVNDVIARLDRRDEDTLPPPMYEDVTHRA